MEMQSFTVVNGSVIDSIKQAFHLPEPDTYIYKTEGASVTIAQAAQALADPSYKYHYFHGREPITISTSDIGAYTDIFKSSRDTEAAIKSFLQNAKKESPRQNCALHQLSRRSLPDDLKSKLTKKKNHLNPFLDVWVVACQDLGFLGPINNPGYADPQAAKQGHPLLPVFMHHFGCAIPTYEAVLLLKIVAGNRQVLDLGCGNGYWSWVLRNEGVQVLPVDDCSSKWRTTWLADIHKSDAITFLRRTETTNMVLLLVYPIVGGNNLTKRMIENFKGDTICIVGTQNTNRYTGFKDMTVEEYFSSRKEWKLLARICLPSFPGKDDGLYVYTKG